MMASGSDNNSPIPSTPKRRRSVHSDEYTDSPFGRNHAYLPPVQPRFNLDPNEGSTTSSFKYRVLLATSQKGLVGRGCLILNDENCGDINRYVHLLERDIPDDTLTNLEFHWNMAWKGLNLDTRYNVICLDINLDVMKSEGRWFLLPEESIINNFYSTISTGNFPQPKDPTYNYKFIANTDMLRVPIHRLTTPYDASTAPPLNGFTFHAFPFSDLPVLVSHAHPQFALCDAGQKLEKCYSRYLDAHPSLSPTFQKVIDIYRAWTKPVDEQEARYRSFFENPEEDYDTSSSQRTIRRRIRRRCDNVETEEQPGSKKHRRSSSTDQPLLTERTLKRIRSGTSKLEGGESSLKRKKAWIENWAENIGGDGNHEIDQEGNPLPFELAHMD